MTAPTARSQTTVGPGFDPHSWDMVGSLELSKQLVSGDVLAELAEARDDVCVLTADLSRPTHLYRHYGIDADGIARTVREALGP